MGDRVATAGKVVVPTATVAAILLAIFGPKINGVSTETIAGYVAVGLGVLAGVMHAPTVKKAAAKAKQLAKRKPRKSPPEPRFVSVFDATDMRHLARIAGDHQDVVAGYDDGLYNNVADGRRLYPGHRLLTICVRAGDPADVIDNEPGNLTTGSAEDRARLTVDWVEWRIREGAKVVGVYADGSDWVLIDAELEHRGLSLKPRYQGGPIIRWKADPTREPHVPDGFDGCQWGWFGSFDESLFYAASLRALS